MSPILFSTIEYFEIFLVVFLVLKIELNWVKLLWDSLFMQSFELGLEVPCYIFLSKSTERVYNYGCLILV